MTKILSFRSSIRTIFAESSLLQLSWGGVCAAILLTNRNAKAKAAKYCLQDPKIFTDGFRLRNARPLDRMRQAHGFQKADEIPANVGLIPAKPQARRAGVRVMILVPILAPSRQLQWAEPPDVDAGIPALFRFAEVRQAVHQALHVQAIDQPHRAHPEKAHPAKSQNQPAEKRKQYDRRFRPAPDFVNPTRHFRRPAFLVGRLGLIQPAQMRPPEAALLRARNIFRQICDRVMQAMISHPASGMPGAVKDRPKDQKLFDGRMRFERLVREHAVIANRRAEPAECGEKHGHAKNLEAWNGKENQAHDGKNVNEDQVGENAFLAVNRFPKGTVPGMRLWRLLRQANFHGFSDDLQN